MVFENYIGKRAERARGRLMIQGKGKDADATPLYVNRMTLRCDFSGVK